MTALIINYKTPAFTEAAVRSVKKGSPKFEVVVYDSSGEYHGPADRLIKNDIDFKELLDRYPNKIETVNDWGSVKHCYTVDHCFDLLPEGFILLDSDVLVKKDLTPLWQPDKIWVGQIRRTNFNYIPRVAPYCCFINVSMCREHGIRYFNDQWMWRLNTNPDHDSNWYDTGAYFLRETRELPHLEAAIDDFVLHFRGASWMEGKKGMADEWLANNSNLYKNGLSSSVCDL